jgi:hypothetical protein
VGRRCICREGKRGGEEGRGRGEGWERGEGWGREEGKRRGGEGRGRGEGEGEEEGRGREQGEDERVKRAKEEELGEGVEGSGGRTRERVRGVIKGGRGSDQVMI